MRIVKLTNALLVTPEGVVDKDLFICEDKLSLSPPADDVSETVDVGGSYVLPGFIDIHLHGYNLFDFTSGRFDPKSNQFDDADSAYTAGFEMLTRTMPRFGVTGLYLASFAAKLGQLQNCYASLGRFRQETPNGPKAARLLGGLLEGTFINPKMAGAQNTCHRLDFSPQVLESIDDSDSIKLANIVPDFGRASITLIRHAVQRGIVVGAGHTDANCWQFEQALEAGLKYCIHFTNGPTGGSFKPFNGGGAIEAVLKLDDIYAEIIPDGYHVNPAYVRDIIARKGPDRVIAATDCMFAASSNLKEITLANLRGRVSEDRSFIRLAGEPATLFGSILTMNKAFENLLNWLTTDMEGIWYQQHQAISFDQALMAASRMCSTNPVILTGLCERDLGVIADHAAADLCVLDIEGTPGQYQVHCEATCVAGQIVHNEKRP